MKFLFKALVTIVLVAVASIAIIVFLVPANSLKPLIEQAASDAIGRDVQIGGDLQWRLWPPLQVEASGLQLANATGFEPAQMVTADRALIDIDATAYFSGTAKIDQLILEKPVIFLRRKADGSSNWQLGDNPGPAGDNKEHAGVNLPELAIGGISVLEGHLSFDDEAAGQSHEVKDLNLSLGQHEEALLLDGSANYNGKDVRLGGQVADLNALANGSASAVDANLSADLLSATIAGMLSTGMARDLELAVKTNSIRDLLDWTSQVVELPPELPESLDLDAALSANAEALNVSRFNLQAGPYSAIGNADVQIHGRPRITALIELGDLDISPFLPPPITEENTADGEGAPSPGWPSDAIDLSLPLPVDVDLSVDFSSITANEIRIGAGSVGLYADSLNAKLHIPSLEIYGGEAEVSADITGFAGEPDINLNANILQIQAGPLLQAIADFDRLEGSANFEASLKTKGQSIKSWIEQLSGDGKVLFRDGAILGINIAATLRQISSLGLDQQAGGERRTDFAELGGTFKIVNGVLTNDDLLLRAPVFAREWRGSGRSAATNFGLLGSSQIVGNIGGTGCRAGRYLGRGYSLGHQWLLD